MIDDMYTQIGLAIRKRRSELGMTQAALASYLGLSRTSVTNIECGRQPVMVHQLVHIGGVLGVSAADFIKAVENVEVVNLESSSAEFAELFELLSRPKKMGSSL